MKMYDQKNGQSPEDMKNLMVFAVVGMMIFLAFDHFIMKPKTEALRAAQQAQQAQSAAAPGDDISSSRMVVEAERPREEVLADSSRLELDNNVITGSVALKGGRIDDIRLRKYYSTLEKEENVVLFSPSGTPYPKYAEFGWIANNDKIKTPDKNTIWRVKGDNPDVRLMPDKPVTLFWENGQGLRFEKILTIDENYLISVKQRVINNTGAPVTLFPYALLTEHGYPENYVGRWIVHEGPIGYIADELHEISYKSMEKEKGKTVRAMNGWIGISEKYWFSSLIPAQGQNKQYRFVYKPPKTPEGKARFQTDVMGDPLLVAAGEQIEINTDLFAGAKEMKLLQKYEEELGVKHFDLAVDFGLYYFLTKPFFYILQFFADLTGSFGLAIICLTIIVRLAVFPLAQTSFRSFAKLREIAPEMKELREKYGDDRQKLQEKLVKLYEKEKVNPMAGCLPILIQIPIFFALFKVLSVSLEMRHAPFYGWIDDMSAKDPTSFMNLFGLLPYEAPGFLEIGAWPCIMFMFLLLQKALNPPPQDKTQAWMLNIMPFFITYILSQFAAGLVIYWTFSNALSVLQQYILMRSMGQEIHLFKRSKSDQEMEKLVHEGPSVHPEIGLIEDEVEDALFGDEEEQAVPQKNKKSSTAATKKKPVTPPKPKKKTKGGKGGHKSKSSKKK